MHHNLKHILQGFELGDLVTVYLSSGTLIRGAVREWIWEEDVFKLQTSASCDEVVYIDVAAIVAVAPGY